MYIKNQSFKDEDTLHEMLFDFSLGNPSEIIKEHLSAIDKELETNTEYKKYLNSLTDEDDKLELQEEECSLRLAEKLLAEFDSFEVGSQKLYGIKSSARTLLYEMDLY